MANKIRLRRLQLDMIQKDVADKLGIHTQQYSLYENGATVPNVVIARNIANVLKVELEVLANWIEQENKKYKGKEGK